MTETSAFLLPPLRDELELLEGPPSASGEPTWTIFDPVGNRYFRVGYTAFELLSHWHLGDSAAVLAAVVKTVPDAGPQQLVEVVDFLQHNNLVRGDTAERVSDYRRQYRAARQSVWQWLLHHYLFFRVPVVHPDRFLDSTLPLVRPLFSRTALYVVLGTGLIGLLMALQQWERFVHTFRHYFSVGGLLWYAVALFSVKVLHELGHAYTVKRYGGRVPAMGFGFLVMIPVLYTDATDAWRLVLRRQRAAIAAAGMIVELSVALLATFAWSFLPDGPARSAAFFLATVSWVMTLTINMSPFTRFDGYYVLSDWLGIENLQTRSFALARWKLREWLFGLGEPRPERFPATTHRLLLIYAYAAWLYRLVLFTGIALIVYHFFFKLLGILLLAVEMGWFVVLPFVRELREWWRRRDRLQVNLNSLATSLIALGALLILVLPWDRHIDLPAVEDAAGYAVLYPASAARVEQVLAQRGTQVDAGQPLYRLSSPGLDSRLRQTASDIDLLQLKLRRRAGSGADLQNQQVLQQQLAADFADRRGLRDEQRRLVVRAPIAGRLMDVPAGLGAGRWVSTRQSLGVVVNPHGARLIAYVGMSNLASVQRHAVARFYPDDPDLPPVDAVVRAVDTVNVKTLSQPYVASVYHGDIPVVSGPDGQLTPVNAIYRVMLEPRSVAGPVSRVIRGHVRVAVAAQSIVGRLWRDIASAVIRQSGF